MKRLRYVSGDLDDLDLRILETLAHDARMPVAALARNIGLSSPSVSERMHRLEEAGVIQGYSATISPAALGRPLAAWLRIKPVPGQMQRVSKIVQGIAEIVECDRITGEDCFIARVRVESVTELESVIDQIIPYANTNTSIVQSTLVERRLPPLTAVKAQR